jgi:phospholipase C
VIGVSLIQRALPVWRIQRRPLHRLSAAVLGGLAALAVCTASAGAEQRPPKTPITHFISLMQQNRSFDSYFGTYPGADGIPKDTCMPADPARPKGRCVRPFHIGNQTVGDLPQDRRAFVDQYHDGKMDGFVAAGREEGGRVNPTVMGYYDENDIPFYWNVADQYVLFDRFFTSTFSGSVRSAMYWVTGTPGNYNGQGIPPNGFGALKTIFDRLEARGISWKFYVQNYDAAINYRNRGSGERSSQVFWVPLLDYNRFIDDPKLSGHIVDLEQYFEDLQRNKLPSVSYIVAPAGGSSEHAPGTVKPGQRFVTNLINALMRSEAWKSSAFMWTYDGWGGWYDHVKPPRVDGYGYGFRAPALLVSPYAKEGYVDSTTLDSTSILKFIETNWGLKPLASRDRRAKSFTSAFNFAQAPRPPAFVTGDRHPVAKKRPNQVVIYGAYVGAMALTAMVIAWATLGWTPFSTGRRTDEQGRRRRR